MLLCIYVVDPATFLASNSVPRTLFSSEFIQLRKKNFVFLSLYHHFMNILSFYVSSEATQCPFNSGLYLNH